MTDEIPHRGHEALVFLETSGNQAYLFATNKLKENIGASQLTYLAGAVWAREAAEAAGGEPILATSGKALIRVPTRAQGEEVIRRVTRRALREAPGMSIAGAAVGLAAGSKEALEEVHYRFNANRDALASTRFPTLPWAVPCATSALPAAGTGTEGKKALWLSAESRAKRARAREWVDRVNVLLKDQARGGTRLWVKENIDDLQADFQDSQWLGVIASDGNGLGQIFMDLDRHLATLEVGDHRKRDPFTTMRAFSEELEAATQRAFYTACLHIYALGAAKPEKGGKGRIYIPVIPLVLGGDDMTVLVQGEFALPFAQRFLTAFEEETGSDRCPTIREIAEAALGAPRLSAGAGVALVKHHFPFHLAHALAEGLLKSSKEAKRMVRGGQGAPFPVSALDFHVLFDASFTDLDTIRDKRLTVAGKDGPRCRLYAGPYVVTPDARLTGATQEGADWARDHAFDALTQRFDFLNAEEEDTHRPCLPSSQMHALREALAQGKGQGDARLRELRWLDQRGLEQIKEPGESLFFEPKGAGDTPWASRFVDAINGAGFWPKHEQDCRPAQPEQEPDHE